MIYIAYELKAKFDAGLVLCGSNADGELEWMGTKQQWDLAGKIQDAVEMYGDELKNTV